MNTTFSTLLDSALERPGWQRGLMLIFAAGCVCALLYFLLLRPPIGQQQDAQRQNAELNLSVKQQQSSLLLQPSLAELSRQLGALSTQSEARILLLDNVSAPLRLSKSTLVQWQPVESPHVEATNMPKIERANLRLTSDFKGLMVLMQALLADRAAPALSQLDVKAQNSGLDAQLSLMSEGLFAQVPDAPGAIAEVTRDPFSRAAVVNCPDSHRDFTDVVLGGVIGNNEQRQGWVLWPGLGWQKVSKGWRDEQSGWQIGAVEKTQLVFDLNQPPCMAQQYRLGLLPQ